MQRWLTGTSLPAVLLMTVAPALAQTAAAPATGVIDTEEPAFDAAATARVPAPTGDATLDRLNALEAKVNALEARNHSLEDALATSRSRIESVEVRAAKGVQMGVVPTQSDPGGNFVFKVRGVIDADAVHFDEHRGGYDYDDGTGFRRARLGFEGTAFKDWFWRLEVDFAGGATAVQDAFLTYNGFKGLAVTLGQLKAPYGLEANNSDNYNTFIERGMFTNAFGGAGAERRFGAQLAVLRDHYTLTGGVFSDNDSIGRSSGAPLTDAPDESIGVNARATWEPVSEAGHIIHVGASGFWHTGLKSGDVANGLRLQERPNIRVDNGNIIDTGVITDVDSVYYAGVEGTAEFGPFSVTGEYGHIRAIRQDGLPNFNADGFYVYASWFVTGETRPFRNGNFDRVKPLDDFSNKGGTGAIEVVARYDDVDVGDTSVLARAGNKAHSYTAGLNWYMTPNFKMQFNYIRFAGTNTPIDPIGNKTAGDAFATRLHLDW